MQNKTHFYVMMAVITQVATWCMLLVSWLQIALAEANIAFVAVSCCVTVPTFI